MERLGKPTEFAPSAVELQALYAKMGQLMLENDFLEGSLNQLR
jgi:transposase